MWDITHMCDMIHMCDMTHTCGMTCADVWHDSRVCAYVWHDLCICVAWLTSTVNLPYTYGVATISRLLKFIGLFCKRARLKSRYYANETYIFKEPTNRSNPVTLLLNLVHINANHVTHMILGASHITYMGLSMSRITRAWHDAHREWVCLTANTAARTCAR